MRLVLASESPRRREILRRAGISFLARPSPVEETPLPGESPAAHVRRLARAKARAARRQRGEWVLAADTVVVLGTKILGKPHSPRDAARMLRSLSGRMHRVLTGVCLLTPRRSHSTVVETKVWFRTLSSAEIARYVASREPFDKAGAYAIQGLASRFVRRIDGDYFNVVGLPLSLVSRWLSRDRLL